VQPDQLALDDALVALADPVLRDYFEAILASPDPQAQDEFVARRQWPDRDADLRALRAQANRLQVPADLRDRILRLSERCGARECRQWSRILVSAVRRPSTAPAPRRPVRARARCQLRSGRPRGRRSQARCRSSGGGSDPDLPPARRRPASRHLISRGRR
jgi:hypothetical protein